jgi:hypothetical protein
MLNDIPCNISLKFNLRFRGGDRERDDDYRGPIGGDDEALEDDDVALHGDEQAASEEEGDGEDLIEGMEA